MSGNIHPLFQEILSKVAPAPSNLPVVSFNSKWRESRPCIVERDGMRFVHDPEVARRTDRFFGRGV